MTLDYFRWSFKNEVNGFKLTKDVWVFRKPFCLWNEKTNEETTFKTLDAMLEHTVDDKKVWDIISKWERLPRINPDGGRGADSGTEKSFSFGHADDRGGGNDKGLFPAYANTKIKSKTFEGALDEFKRNHLLANREFAYEVDSNGYVNQYVRGGAHSVGISSNAKVRKGEKTMIIHNHPSGGAFSDSDLISTSMDAKSRGIIASGKNYDYIFQKGQHFKAQAFAKAVRNATMKGKDYDDAADKWLKRNAKKYGYTYKRNKN